MPLADELAVRLLDHVPVAALGDAEDGPRGGRVIADDFLGSGLFPRFPESGCPYGRPDQMSDLGFLVLVIAASLSLAAESSAAAEE